MRVYFTTWGHGVKGLRRVPAYAMRKHTGLHAAYDVVDAIARANNLASISLRHDGGAIYQATLGKRCRAGGYAPEAEIWFCIDG